MEVVVIKQDDELQHHGIKGQRWGQRRFQNKDGSLTPAGQKRYNKEVEKLKAEEAKVKAAEKVAKTKAKTQAKLDKLDAKKAELEERKKALKKGEDPDKKDNTPEETLDQKRERLLKSSDPKEIYKDRDALTYQELNERVNRIDLETRLQNKIPAEPTPPTAMDKMDKATNAINKATNLYKSVDGAVSTVANSYIGKTLADTLGIELPKKEKTFDINEFWENRHKKSAQEMMEANKWLTAEDSIKKKKDARDAEAAEAKKQAEEAKAAKEAEKNKAKAQKEVDDYNEKYAQGQSDDKVTSTKLGPDGEYNYKKENLSNAKDDTRTVQYYPAVVNTSLSAASSSRAYSTGESYVKSNASKTSATRMSSKDVEVTEPDWYKRMKANGQL